MQLVKLPVVWTLIIDILAWAVFHIGISLFALKLPAAFFEKTAWLYRTRGWENNGQFWQQRFKVKAYAKYIPDGSHILKAGFYKKKLQQQDMGYLSVFILETKRAELTHGLSIMPAFLFFIWNPVWAGWLMVGYALCFNVPLMILQRYNRPRLEKILKQKSQRSKEK